MTATAGKWPVLSQFMFINAAGMWDKLSHTARRAAWPVLSQLTIKDTVEQKAPHGNAYHVECFAPLNISGGAEQ